MNIKDEGGALPCRNDESHVDEEGRLQALAAQADEKKLVRKLDLYLIPLIMCLYLFSFLDR